MNVNHFLENYRLHLFIILSWLALYSFNFFVLAPLTYKTHISFIFFPAGLRIAFATIFRMEAAIGLFLGSLLTGFIFLENIYRNDVFIFAFLSTFSPIAAVYSVNFFINIGSKCEYLTLKTAIAISIIYSGYCAFFHNFYIYKKYNISDIEFIQDTIAMFIGDLTGGFIFLIILASQKNKIINYLIKFK